MAAKAKINSREILKYFGEKFNEYYGIEYPFVYVRDVSQVKRVLVSTYNDVEIIQKIIDYYIHNHKNRWATARYPIPTVTGLCSWCHTNCYLAIKDQQESKCVNGREEQFKTIW